MNFQKHIVLGWGHACSVKMHYFSFSLLILHFKMSLKVLTNIVEFHLPVGIGCVLEVEWTMTSKICHKNKHNFMIVAGELAKGEAVEIKITV